MTEHVSASAVPVSAAKGFSRQNKGEKKIMKNVNEYSGQILYHG